MSTHARETKFIACLSTMDLTTPEGQLQPEQLLRDFFSFKTKAKVLSYPLIKKKLSG
jgi:hypothetical protein